jgi:hypothetical protein
MPVWVISFVLPFVIQAITPILVDFIKKGVDAVGQKLPGSVQAAVAGAVASALDAAQTVVTGSSVPYGLAPLVAIVINEMRGDIAKYKSAKPA